MKKLTLKEIGSYIRSQVEEFTTVLKGLKGKPVSEMAKSILGTVVGKTACGVAAAVVVTGTAIGIASSAGGGSKALKMIQVPNELFYIQQTEVTKALFKKTMNRDPGEIWQVNADDIPVVNVSLLDAVEFCNRLSDKEGYEKAYSVSGDKVTWNKSASGYRLPTVEEWMYAAKGNEKFKYSGSDNLDEVAWFANSTLDKKSKIVRNKKWEKNNTLPGHTITSAQVGAKKKPNAYGIYDMSGNVEEICWKEKKDGYEIFRCGGSFISSDKNFELSKSAVSFNENYWTGFRLARNISDADFEKNLNMTKIPERNIFMGATEVTQLVYEKVMGKNPASHKGRQLPVESVSWYDAVEFCNTLSQMYNLKPAYFVDDKKNVAWDQEADGYRLPTEAEWEFCSKGGQNYKYSGSDDIDEVAWYSKNSNKSIHAIAEKKANGYGLYDMSGNVFEWCWDPAFENEKSSYDKGGSYKNKEDTCSITAEDDSDKNSKYSNLGIRLVRGKISDIDRKAGEEKLAGKITEKEEKLAREREKARREMERAAEVFSRKIKMIKIPGKNYEILKTEVTQELYEVVMGSNPSRFKNIDNPVETVSWFDAVYFCNKLSKMKGKIPVYSVNGTSDFTKWNYIPHERNRIEDDVTQNINANGYRLHTVEEWEYAAKGGEDYKYSGSDNLNEVGWHFNNSEYETHPVAQKKANGYGLYDMSGNVCEWCWDTAWDKDRNTLGGGYYSLGKSCLIIPEIRGHLPPEEESGGNGQGFRIVCSAK